MNPVLPPPAGGAPPPCDVDRAPKVLSAEARAILGEFEDKFAEVGFCASTGKPVTICYNTFGDPSNPCLLMVQGFGTSLLGFAVRFVQYFVDQGYFVIRYDNRDVGRSTCFEEFGSPALIRLGLPEWMSIGERLPYTLHDMMEDGIGLLKKLEIDQAHVFGLSMGGMIVQLMAIHHPERVLSLNVLFSNAGGKDTIDPSLLHYARFLWKPRSDSVEDHAAHMVWFISYLSQGAYNDNLEEVKKYILCSYERNGVSRDQGSPRHAAAVMRSPSRAAGLRNVRCPALILHGAKDPLIPVANGYRLAELLPNAKLVIFPRLGHDFPQELMKPIADEILLNMSLVQMQPQ